MFVIKRTDQGGGFVAISGHRSSYTFDIRHVRQFRSREEAERDRCPGNEVIIPLSEVTALS